MLQNGNTLHHFLTSKYYCTFQWNTFEYNKTHHKNHINQQTVYNEEYATNQNVHTCCAIRATPSNSLLMTSSDRNACLTSYSSLDSSWILCPLCWGFHHWSWGNISCKHSSGWDKSARTLQDKKMAKDIYIYFSTALGTWKQRETEA